MNDDDSSSYAIKQLLMEFVGIKQIINCNQINITIGGKFSAYYCRLRDTQF